MGNEKQREKSWKDVLLLLRVEVQKGLAI